MDSSAFNGIGEAMGCLLMVAIVSVPLGIWKLIDICIWLYEHVSISVGG